MGQPTAKITTVTPMWQREVSQHLRSNLAGHQTMPTVTGMDERGTAEVQGHNWASSTEDLSIWEEEQLKKDEAARERRKVGSTADKETLDADEEIWVDDGRRKDVSGGYQDQRN